MAEAQERVQRLTRDMHQILGECPVRQAHVIWAPWVRLLLLGLSRDQGYLHMWSMSIAVILQPETN